MELKIDREVGIETLEQLENSCFKGDVYTKEQLEDILSHKELYKIIAVERDGKVAAYAIIFDNSVSLEIMKIATLKEYRKQGLGALIIKELSKYGKDIFLEVRETNEMAIKFYHENGFVDIGKRKHYYSDTGEAAILMEKKYLSI